MTHKKAAVLNMKTLYRLTFKHLLLDGTAVIGGGGNTGNQTWLYVGHWDTRPVTSNGSLG